MIETMNALICQLSGIDPLDPTRGCLDIDQTTKKIGYVKPETNTKTPKVGGALGFLSNSISATYNIPISSQHYVQYLASDFGLVKTSFGQNQERTGQGFSNLQPTLRLWTKARDLTYTLFILLFVLVGIAIMLRLKIDPRTTMSLQNQIPKIIITLLLVTFSYSIAGAVIDLMWVTTYLGVNLVAEGESCEGRQLTDVATRHLLETPFDYVSEIYDDFSSSNWNNSTSAGCIFNKGIMGSLFGGRFAIGDLANQIGGVLNEILGGIISSAIGFEAPAVCRGSFLRAVTPGGLGAILCPNAWLDFFVGRIASLVILTAIVVQLFRIWFSLLKSYIYLFIYTIMGPIWIVMGIIPGISGYGFRDWLNHLLFAVSVYPVTVLLIVVSLVIMTDPAIRNATSTGNVFVPPLIANPAIGNNLGFMLGLAVLLIIPEVVNMMRGAFKSPPSKYTAAIFGGAAVGLAAATKPVSAGWGALNERDNTGMARGMLAYKWDTTVGKRLRKFAYDAAGNEKGGAFAHYVQQKFGRYGADIGAPETETQERARERREKREAEARKSASQSAIDQLGTQAQAAQAQQVTGTGAEQAASANVTEAQNEQNRETLERIAKATEETAEAAKGGNQPATGVPPVTPGRPIQGAAPTPGTQEPAEDDDTGGSKPA